MKTIKAKNGKSYTKKQICEAIEYWKKQLKRLDEGRYRNGNKISNDSTPDGTCYDHSTYPKYGEEVSIITKDEYLNHKIYPNEIIEKCHTINDLYDLHNKYRSQYLLIEFKEEIKDDEYKSIPKRISVIPINAEDGIKLAREYGLDSSW